jgi:hypothetical protein
VEKIIQIELDEKLQIIRQHLAGDLDDTDNARLVAETQACVDRMKNPNDVRVLFNAQGLRRANGRLRKAFIHEQKRANLTKLAVWNASIMMRTALKFLTIVDPSSKMRHFNSEQEALDWLLG